MREGQAPGLDPTLTDAWPGQLAGHGNGHRMAMAHDLDAGGQLRQIGMRHRKLRQELVAPMGPRALQQLAASIRAVVAAWA